MTERDRFLELVRDLPLVSVDLVFVRDGREVLLGLRTNRPAKGTWFVPGGRILKDEKISAALKRVAARELGIADIALLKPKFLGPYEHMYADCFAGDIGVSTHYVVLAYRIDVPVGFEAPGSDEQHEALRWWSIEAVKSEASVHHNTRVYFEGPTQVHNCGT